MQEKLEKITGPTNLMLNIQLYSVFIVLGIYNFDFFFSLFSQKRCVRNKRKTKYLLDFTAISFVDQKR